MRGDTRVKSIKVTVMSKKRSSVFQEKIHRDAPQKWQTVMTKKVASFFQKKIGITPSVAAPDDTLSSSATVRTVTHLELSPVYY